MFWLNQIVCSTTWEEKQILDFDLSLQERTVFEIKSMLEA